MIQTLEYNIRKFCAYGVEFKYSDDLTNNLCTLIPALKLAYRKSIHLSTGKTPAILEKRWNTRLTYDTTNKDFLEIHPKERSFNIVLYIARHHEDRCMQDSYKYSKKTWHKSHKPPDFIIG
ncbi:hypothetical protein O181_089371 [Austropuccinia psidii MF-1]|uniref:Uncharacterized protein n=1 Tax=Austropuccinia psidii MF-1 TaxID=1389203 RepID=A0A9Q3ITC6_9BASI|nr:hypothetical protein [Austropuccinia psidii MF-1]